MADLYNDFPSWGESGSYPAAGFFYEGGDQVNEKHLDALWNGVKVHIDNINQAIRDRVRHLDGDVVMDGGLVASTTANTREISVSASNRVYVDGQLVENVGSQTVTLSTNGTSSTRTDSIWLNTSGTVGATEGTTSVANDRLKIAEVDVSSSDTISAVRNVARDFAEHIASENAPSGAAGNLWYDLTSDHLKAYSNGAFRKVALNGDTGTFEFTGNVHLNTNALNWGQSGDGNGYQIRPTTADNPDLEFVDTGTTDTVTLVLRDGGNIKIPNGGIQKSGTLTIGGGGGGDVVLYDGANLQDIIRANQGGSVNIPNGTLTVRGGASITGNGKVDIANDPNSNGAISIGDSTKTAGTDTPYFDFNYSVGGSQDFNVRIINDGDELLAFKGATNGRRHEFDANTGDVNIDGTLTENASI